MIKKELRIFLVVGVSAVLIDFLVYRGLLLAGLPVNPSKCASFIAGAVFAYIVNRLWTFGHVRSRRGSALRFTALYLIALAANVAVNALMLKFLAGQGQAIAIAFVVATGFSATLNFLGMKFFVFTPEAA